MTLQQCFNKELVKKQLQELLLTARHTDAIEREVPETQMSHDDFSGVVVLNVSMIDIVCFTAGQLLKFIL